VANDFYGSLEFYNLFGARINVFIDKVPQPGIARPVPK